MGFDTALFVVQPVDEDMLCHICHSVQDKPTVACKEGHTFCAGCLEGWEKRSNQCPDCRSAIPEEKVLNRPLQTIIAKLEVRCPKDGAKRARVTRASTSSIQRCDWQGLWEPIWSSIQPENVILLKSLACARRTFLFRNSWNTRKRIAPCARLRARNVMRKSNTVI